MTDTNEASSSMRQEPTINAGKRENDKNAQVPSITISVFACWIVPVLLIAALTRFASETPPPYVPPPSQKINFDFSKQKQQLQQQQQQSKDPAAAHRRSPKEQDAEADGVFDILKDKPVSYQTVRTTIVVVVLLAPLDTICSMMCTNSANQMFICNSNTSKYRQ